jgi:hypothetical protein
VKLLSLGWAMMTACFSANPPRLLHELSLASFLRSDADQLRTREGGPSDSFWGRPKNGNQFN